MPRKKALVTQSNRLIEARYTLTTAEQKLILALISKIQPEDNDLKPYTMSLDELAQLMDITVSNCRLEIAAITKRLIGRVLTLQTEPGHFVQVGWICRAEHKPGFVSVSFVPDLKPYLLRLKREFTICDLSVVNQFSGKYTIRIYMLLRQYASIGWREFDLAELRKILGIEKNEYREYKRFSQRVLAQAKKEMDEVDEYGRPKSDLSFEVETIRQGRKIARLKFIIVKNKKTSAKPAKNSIGQAVSQAASSVNSPPAAQPQPSNIKRRYIPDFEGLEKQLFHDFLEHAKKHDTFIYKRYLEEGYDMMVQYEYKNFLEK
jgi:plasmid replication initiation protein